MRWFDAAMQRHQNKLEAQIAVKQAQKEAGTIQPRRRIPNFTDAEVKVWEQRLGLGEGVAKLARECNLTISEFARRLQEYRNKQ